MDGLQLRYSLRMLLDSAPGHATLDVMAMDRCDKCGFLFEGSACPRCVGQQFAAVVRNEPGEPLDPSETIVRQLAETNRWLRFIYDRLGWVMWWVIALILLRIAGCFMGDYAAFLREH